MRRTQQKLNRFSIYGGRDPRYLPSYNIEEAARYLNIPEATLNSWVRGRSYPAGGRRQFSAPIINRPEGSSQLSFINIVEAHVLDATRRLHKVPFYKVRAAVDYLKKQLHSEHPLAEQEFETNGLDLFIEKSGDFINTSRDGQLAMRVILQAYLHRIERDISGAAVRLYPFTRSSDLNEQKAVVIDPLISFGRPVLRGTGIPTAIIAERYKAGEDIDALATDYGRERLEIEEAIRCELKVAA